MQARRLLENGVQDSLWGGCLCFGSALTLPVCTQVRKLLKNGVEASYQREADGLSGLMVAAERGNTALVSELLQAGAPWNALDRRGCCAGEYADAAGQQGTFDQLVQAGGALWRTAALGVPGQAVWGFAAAAGQPETTDQLVQAGGGPSWEGFSLGKTA